MTSITFTNHTVAHGSVVRQTAQRFAAAVEAYAAAYFARISRTDELERLHAMDDAQLAKLGITRAGIPAYVFRDKCMWQ
ncbi:hypothetical protein SAMN04490244_106239 [Tranquillimonas rosea]|uniref:DUF1127 domain-containing protein n=1 Tax=Tranquillimonas rosea TaxID=641238 RepID=A0A1H9V407_9RHOB|nr:hypothetical protein [Tranquillimonas rosea]SES16550.1 hypothetical protein SAMN04490244_106239 [Tranquillimonas rosea]